MNQYLVARMDDGAVVETHMRVKRLKAVADLDGTGHLLFLFG